MDEEGREGRRDQDKGEEGDGEGRRRCRSRTREKESPVQLWTIKPLRSDTK